MNIRGSPAIMSITVNGIRKAPPPFEQQRYGNRHTLPRPTLYPKRDNRKSNFPVHVPRSGCSSSPACNGAWLFATEYLSSFCYKWYMLLFHSDSFTIIQIVLTFFFSKFDRLKKNRIEFTHFCEDFYPMVLNFRFKITILYFLLNMQAILLYLNIGKLFVFQYQKINLYTM